MPEVFPPTGNMLCDECMGWPHDYKIANGCDCPRCHGVGHHSDPDYIPGFDMRDFDPRREWGHSQKERL